MRHAVCDRQLRSIPIFLLLMFAGALRAQQNCTHGYATTVVSSSVGSSPFSGRPASDALGDTPDTYFSTGNNGSITVAFAQTFGNTGDSGQDITVDERSGNGTNDFYWICLVPLDSATAAVLAQAGWVSFSNGTLWQIPMLFCEDVSIDIDLFLPGHAAGTLNFTSLMIEDDGSGGNGAEIARVKAWRVCPPALTPPCAPLFASSVINSYEGSNNQGTPASNALGDTPGIWFSMGNGGSITVGFPVNFTTSGDATPDIFVDENGVADCYWICIVPADAFTNSVLLATGFNHSGNVHQLPMIWCGDAFIDIDGFLPGHATGDLLFSAVMVEDDGNGGNGGDVERIRVDLACMPAPTCAPGCAATVPSIVVGTGRIAAAANPSAALGNTPNDYCSLGGNGSIALCFANLLTTDGGSGSDLDIDEYDVSDCD